jgi:hypothetical protein
MAPGMTTPKTNPKNGDIPSATCTAPLELQYDPGSVRHHCDVLLAFGSAPEQPGWLAPAERYSLGRCSSTRIRTSASVESSMSSGMMIGRGKAATCWGLATRVLTQTLPNYRAYSHLAASPEAAAPPTAEPSIEAAACDQHVVDRDARAIRREV